tara:strand:- start:275 stop:1291 length:1017 start_codon:yes stop_codon:yes gene_type:complete
MLFSLGENMIKIKTNCICIVLIIFFSSQSYALDKKIQFNQDDWERWLTELKQEALNKGISNQTLNAAFKDITPIKRVIELDRKQPEFTLTFDQYLKHVVPKQRIAKGRLLLKEYRELLNEVSREFKVQPRFIVALWGIETDYGRVTGGFKVIDSLATLAFDGRRSSYFRKELFYALQILDEGHIAVDKMKGSWAGAMGQPQFMPSSFINFAIDFDKDGKKDIWRNKIDVFASAANYLTNVGWDNSQTWGREVKLPNNFKKTYISNKTIKKIGEWQKKGVRLVNGKDLPKRQLNSKIIFADKKEKRAFMVYNNFQSTLRWNRSIYFALAVGMLADKISK